MLNLLNWGNPIEVNGKSYRNSDEAYEELKDFKGRVEIRLNIKNGQEVEKTEPTQLVETVDKGEAYVTYTIDIPQWLAKKNNCPSALKGYVERETDRAIYFVGIGLVDNPVKCCACGRELTNEVSMRLGIGPVCAEKMYGIGFENPDELENMMVEKEFKLWLPKSQIELN